MVVVVTTVLGAVTGALGYAVLFVADWEKLASINTGGVVALGLGLFVAVSMIIPRTGKRRRKASGGR